MQRIRETAIKLREYFERHEAEQPGRWARNVEVSREWCRLVELEAPPEADVRQLLSDLQAPDAHQGTAWYELGTWVRKWAAEHVPLVSD